jgi:hypothetical protein
MFFWTLFLILVVVKFGYSEPKITVNGGTITHQESFSPHYTVPRAMKDDTPFLTEEIERLPSLF